jgi:glycosidase
MWAFETSFYQIYTLGFCGAPFENDGIQEHRILKVLDWIPHLKKLGVGAVLFNPVFESDTHGYNTRDYRKIDVRLGTNEDFKKVCDELHKEGIRIVLDAVFNHVSELNDKFRDCVEKGSSSPYFDWFVINGKRPEKDPLNYEVFAGCKYMPKWNTSNPDVQDYLISIATYYIKEFDIDGWRLDVSDEISHDFWRKFRKEVKAAKKDAVIIGENWHDASNYLRGDQYDSIMNYAFTKAALDFFAYDKFDAKAMACKLNDILARNTDTVNDMMLNLLDSHDTDRFFSEIHEDRDKLKAALALLYLFPGAPSIFYGTECYTVGGYDPDCRRCMDWENGSDKELSELLKKLSEIRKESEMSFVGTRIYASEDGKLLCVERHGENADVALHINQSGSTFRLFVNGGEVV